MIPLYVYRNMNNMVNCATSKVLIIIGQNPTCRHFCAENNSTNVNVNNVYVYSGPSGIK